MNASIIGAGIAGCATALFLNRAGIPVTLYEQRAASDADEGLFLTLAPNGLRVLEELGLASEVRRKGVDTPGLTFTNAKGRALGEVSLMDGGTSSVTIRRAALHRILRQELERQAVAIRWGMRLTEVGVDDTVQARFENGHGIRGGIPVGCDGVRSRVRRMLFPEAPEPAGTGLSTAGGFVEQSTLPRTAEGMRMIYGDRAFFGYIVSASGEVMWFSTFDSTAFSASSADEALKQELLGLHDGDGSVVREIIRSTRHPMRVYAIHDMLKFRKWTRGAAVLLGDAAHAASPHGGQGASMALEDAWCLTETLRGRGSEESAASVLQRFAEARQPRVEKIVRWSRRRGSGKVASSAMQRRFRDFVMPMALRVFARPALHAWVYRSPLSD